MSNKFKEIDVKNRTYYFFHGMINKKNLDPNKIKIEKAIKKYFHLLPWIICSSQNP